MMRSHSTRSYKILSQNRIFQLVQRSKDEKKWYEVRCDQWQISSSYSPYSTDQANPLEQVRNFFDPNRTKSGKFGKSWKYRNRKDAEAMFITATLRWS